MNNYSHLARNLVSIPAASFGLLATSMFYTTEEPARVVAACSSFGGDKISSCRIKHKFFGFLILTFEYIGTVLFIL
jgi:hypothetical protein